MYSLTLNDEQYQLLRDALNDAITEFEEALDSVKFADERSPLRLKISRARRSFHLVSGASYVAL